MYPPLPRFRELRRRLSLHIKDMGPANIGELDSARALFASLIGERFEMCGFAYLARDHTLLGVRHIPSASFAQIDVPIRTVATDAMALDAETIVMAHNHPSGDPTPSEDDILVTRRLARAFSALGIVLTEHYILAETHFISMREFGIL